MITITITITGSQKSASQLFTERSEVFSAAGEIFLAICKVFLGFTILFLHSCDPYFHIMRYQNCFIMPFID